MTAYNHESEESVVKRAIQQDRAAFASLYDKYMDKVYRHVYYRVPTRADAEDITQEVFIKAWRAITKYRQTGTPFGAWLIAIARNSIVDFHKARKNNVRLDDTEIISRHIEADPQAMTEFSLGNEKMRKVVLKLKENKREVILLRFFEGWSYREISESLHKSEGAIRIIQYRALADLRQILRRGDISR